MFYDRFVMLCNQRGVTTSKAAVESGVNKSTVTYWKNTPDAKPTGQIAERLCAYFKISMSELYGDGEKPLVNDDQELTEYLEELKNRPDKRMLFSVTKNATKEQIESIVRWVEEWM